MPKAAFSFARDFHKLPKKKEPEYLLDTNRLNKLLVAKNQSPSHWKEGTFMLPDKGLDQWAAERLVKEKCWAWINSLAKQGWDLDSKPEVRGPFPAFDIDKQTVVPDKREFRVRALFKTVPKPIRIEVPTDSIKQDPDHAVTLREALKFG